MMVVINDLSNNMNIKGKVMIDKPMASVVIIITAIINLDLNGAFCDNSLKFFIPNNIKENNVQSGDNIVIIVYNRMIIVNKN